ncbi:MAG: class I SAM-dependent rRNA methyltransferase, partial [Firmicutes bacterium]|nr:class I SAM-dependent rRNA methyltransferase [Bacillota bacterium]
MLRNKEVTISKKAKKRIEKGGLWIYRSEIQEDISSIPVGELVQVKTETEYIGRGYIHPKQTISIRLLTQKNEPITSDLFE